MTMYVTQTAKQRIADKGIMYIAAALVCVIISALYHAHVPVYVWLVSILSFGVLPFAGYTLALMGVKKE